MAKIASILEKKIRSLDKSMHFKFSTSIFIRVLLVYTVCCWQTDTCKFIHYSLFTHSNTYAMDSFICDAAKLDIPASYRANGNLVCRI